MLGKPFKNGVGIVNIEHMLYSKPEEKKRMKSRKNHLLTPVAGAIATALAPAQQALAQDQDNEVMGLEEVLVTATKVTTSVQDIAATVQAITSDDLAAMGAKGMDDYSRFIPSMSVISFGAGSSTIVFRGAVTGQGYIAQSTSSVYLDEISLTTTGAQPSIRMVDIERVEALSGPQGTLYGSDAQAGTEGSEPVDETVPDDDGEEVVEADYEVVDGDE